MTLYHLNTVNALGTNNGTIGRELMDGWDIWH